jgi:uncharacterized protein YndB with AHSA1/START domain/uncharacterized damage-inducible protein DinB
MTTTAQAVTVKKSVTVKADVEHAFDVFTGGFDTWWPRSHHIGKKALQKAVIEPRAGGRCFGREADGTECQWGTVTAWDPPNRLVIAWHIAPNFQSVDLDQAKSSEVDVRFTAQPGGVTRVDVEHRHLERHGSDFESLRTAVASPGGWSGLLQMFARTGNVYAAGVKPVAFIFASNDGQAERSFPGVAEGDLWKQPAPQSNSMLWIFAHMVSTRANILKLLGDDFDSGWGETFGRGAALQDASGYPSREKINEVAREVNRRLYAKLGALTDADVSKAASRSFTNAVQTLGDQVAFLAMHDTYHVGQLAYVRKALGLPGVVG